MGRGDRPKVRWARDRQRKKKSREKAQGPAPASAETAAAANASFDEVAAPANGDVTGPDAASLPTGQI